jgi:hypothetical protein
MTNHLFIYFLICILKFVHPYPKGSELNVPAPLPTVRQALWLG